MVNKDNEIDLLEASLEGNTASFEVIVNKYQSFICALTFSATGNVEMSEELAQETFISAWKNLSQLKDLNKFRSWLGAIARDIVRNSFRGQRRDILSKAVPLDASECTVISDAVEKDDELVEKQQAVVGLALQKVPVKYREPLVLFYRQEQCIREVAEQLELSEAAVRQRLSRGRKMLKTQVATIVESTLARSGPGKAFTGVVIGSIASISVKGVAASASVIAATSSIGSSGATTGVTAILGSISAKIVTAVALVAIGVGSTVAYKALNKSSIPVSQIHADVVIEEDLSGISEPELAGEDIQTEQINDTISNNPIMPAKSVSNQTVVDDTLKSFESDSQEQPCIADVDEQAGRLIDVYVTDKKTGEPIEMATVYTFGGRDTFGITENGSCQFHWDKDKDQHLDVWVRKDGYVRMSYKLRPENTPGDKPVEVHYALEKGTTIGGFVQDPNGINLAGAELIISVNHDEHMEKPENNVYASVKTDGEGRWEFDGVPSQLEAFAIIASHIDYAKTRTWISADEDIQALRLKEYVLVVDSGYSIHGTVRDEDGNPIDGSRIQLGDWYGANDDKHRTTTDANGSFGFNYLDINKFGYTYAFVEGQGNVRVSRRYEHVTVSAEGFAPTVITAFFEGKHVNLDFVLKAGSVIFGRVVDHEGVAVSDATVRVDDWSPYPGSIRSLDWNTKTDSEGRFVWEHAPAEEVELEILKDGFMVLQAKDIKPSDVEYEFVLNRKIRVNCQIINAVTKERVTEFSFRRHEGGHISTKVNIKDDEGKLTTAFQRQSDSFSIDFEAKGYKPVRSRSILPGEQDVELIVEMEPNEGIDGMVVDFEGNGLEGVRVIIPKGTLHLYDMKYDPSRQRYHYYSITDSEGRFHFDPMMGDKYSFLVLEEAGYVFMNAEDFPEDGKLVVQPYGRIVGDYYKGSEPIANETIRVDYPNYHYGGMRSISVSYGVQTDAEGKFVFDKLIHGTVRILIDPYKEVEIKAGEIKEVFLGGDGLTVTGQLLNPKGEPLNEEFGDCNVSFQRTYDQLPFLEDEMPWPENADAMSYAELIGWFSEFVNSDEGREWVKAMEQEYGDLSGHHSFDVDSNGRFEVHNVKPGAYLLSVIVRPWQNYNVFPRRTDYKGLLGQVSKSFVVPDFETVEEMAVPVNIGVLKCRRAPLEVGMRAPDFEIEKLKSDGRIRLDDYRGKTVLLNFTNPALNEIEPDKAAALEQLCEQVNARNDVAIINVAMESIPWDFMREKMISECTLPGIYGVAQTRISMIGADYKLGVLPASVLIGPDGVILWKGLSSDELLDALMQPIP